MLQLYCNLSTWKDPIEIRWECEEFVSCWRESGVNIQLALTPAPDYLTIYPCLWRNLDRFRGLLPLFIVHCNIYVVDEQSGDIYCPEYYTDQLGARMNTSWPIRSLEWYLSDTLNNAVHASYASEDQVQ